MKRSTPLSRTDSLSRTQGLRSVSKRRAREQRQRRKVMIAAFGETPACAIRWDENCTGWADAPHELRKASQGGSRVDPANCVPSCHHCNGMVEDFPDLAHERGFVVRREDLGGDAA